MDVPRIITLTRHEDSRGWFSETYRRDQLADRGIFCDFVQENQSYTLRKGTVRGLHFQSPPAEQAKLISILTGRILDVIVDVRRHSGTYGKHLAEELDSEFGKQVYIPVGFAHGFVTLTDRVLVSDKVSNYFAPNQDGGIRWNDPTLGIEWPVEV